MSGWTKLFASIVTSSVWVEDDATLRVWIAMLATADANGVVEGSVPGLASLCRITVAQMESALATLSGPDPYSRTPDHEGRRIEAVPGGWRLLNYPAYRDRGQDKDGSRAPYMRAWRQRQREDATRDIGVTDGATRDTEAEARGRSKTAEAEMLSRNAGTSSNGLAVAVTLPADLPTDDETAAALLGGWVRRCLPDLGTEAMTLTAALRARATTEGSRPRLLTFLTEAMRRAKAAKNPSGMFLTILKGGIKRRGRR